MKICVVHRYPINLIKGTNPSLPHFLNKLVDRGHEAHLVTYKNDTECLAKEKIYFSEINITFKRKNFIGSFVKSLLFIFIAPIKVLFLDKMNDFDLIYCDDSLPLYDLFIKFLVKKPVFIRRGDLMCAYIQNKFNVFTQALFRVVFLIEKYTWKSVDGISVITEEFKRYILKHGINASKVSIIEDSIEFEDFQDCNDSFIKEKYNISDEFVIMFHGILSKIKDLDTLLHSIPLVVRDYEKIKLFVVGDGEELNRLKKSVIDLKIGKYVIFPGWVKYSDIKYYLSLCNVGIPIRKSTLANNYIITTALLQYWVSAKPVIAPKLKAIEQIVREDTNGFLFSPGDSKDLAFKIIKAIKNRDSLEQIGKNGRNFAMGKYNADIIATKMCNFMNL